MDLSKLTQEFNKLDQNSSTSNNFEVELLKSEIVVYKEFINDVKRTLTRMDSKLKAIVSEQMGIWQNWVTLQVYQDINYLHVKGQPSKIIEQMFMDIESNTFNITEHFDAIKMLIDKELPTRNMQWYKFPITMKVQLDELQKQHKLKAINILYYYYINYVRNK